MPPIVKDTEVPGSPVSATPVTAKSEKSTLLQMPATYRPGTEAPGRVQPVALEVPVSVNGARTLDGTDAREPFSETTKTVLVFGNGAVIRLHAPVATGQLLFLTNEKTKREVVCQVVKSKTYSNVSGYVEIEFTEPSVGFWGVRFPADRIGPLKEHTPIAPTAPLPASVRPEQKCQSPDLPKSVEPAAPSAGSPVADYSFDSFPFTAPTVAPPIPASTKTVPALPLPGQPGKSLDELLAELNATLPASAKSAAPPKTAPEPTLEIPAFEELPSFLADQQRSSTNSSEPKIPSKIENDAQPSANRVANTQSEETEIPAWLIPKSSPALAVNRSADPPAKVESAAVAQAVETVSEGSSESQGSIISPFGTTLSDGMSGRNSLSAAPSRNGLWIGVAAAVLVLSAGGYWYFEQPPSTTVAAASSAPVETSKAPVPWSRDAVSSRPSTTTSAPDAARGKAEPTLSTSSPANPAKNPPAPGLTGDTAISSAPSQLSQPKIASLGKLRLAAPVSHAKASSQVNVAAPAFEQSLPSTASIGASLASGQPVAPSAPAAPSVVGGNVAPAKLLSSVQPSYSAMAKAQHVSGDVKIDALIDANGRVTTMKMLSGPALLQQSARDALRQWKYQPAMLNGSPVSMHLTVTLQFRLQ